MNNLLDQVEKRPLHRQDHFLAGLVGVTIDLECTQLQVNRKPFALHSVRLSFGAAFSGITSYDGFRSFGYALTEVTSLKEFKDGSILPTFLLPSNPVTDNRVTILARWQASQAMLSQAFMEKGKTMVVSSAVRSSEVSFLLVPGEAGLVIEQWRPGRFPKYENEQDLVHLVQRGAK